MPEFTESIAALEGQFGPSAQFDDFGARDLFDAGGSGHRHSRTALNLGLQAGRQRLRIFGLGGCESNRELRLKPLCCRHRLGRETPSHEREYPRRKDR